MRIIYFIFSPFLLINNLAAQTKQTPIIPITISNQDNSLCDPHDEKVCTPFGLALKSKIHYVDKNHHLKIIKGQVQIINKRSGDVDEVYGEKNTSKSAVEMNIRMDGILMLFMEHTRSKNLLLFLLQNGMFHLGQK